MNQTLQPAINHILLPLLATRRSSRLFVFPTGIVSAQTLSASAILFDNTSFDFPSSGSEILKLSDNKGNAYVLSPCLYLSLSHPNRSLDDITGGVTFSWKDLQPILPAARTRQDIIRLGSTTLSPNQLKEAVEPLYVLLAAKRCVQIDSVEKDPVILDLQDVHSTTGPLGTGIAERSTMQREVFEFSMSGLSCAEKAGLDMSLVSDLTGLHSVETDMHRLPIIPSLVYPNFQFSTQSALSDFMGDLVRNSK
ncbi:hypothetical protein ACJRO7_019653 [Eucalyptus globulus]|uniref:Uncharacterized protein n=1 Tax=Eucalyptus globulus TaxID=34317 RepID=A0ABD3KFM4_EUCGL